MERALLVILVCCSAAFFVAGCAGVGEGAQAGEEVEAPAAEEAEASPDQPNIIFLLTDDLDYTSA